MKIELVTGVKESVESATVVVFSHSSKKDGVKITPAPYAKEVAAAIEAKDISGKSQEVVFFRDKNVDGYRHLMVAGIGSDWIPEDMRQLAAQILTHLKSLKISKSVVMLDGLAAARGQNLSMIQAFTEGMLLANYEFNELKSSVKKDAASAKFSVSLVTKSAAAPEAKKAFQEALTLSDCVNFSRRLGDMPGNLMTPTILAKTAVDKAKGSKIRAQVWDAARMKKEGMGGILGVAAGSHQPPKFIILEYKGAATSKKPLVFVGKGLTFDTGGISIKPSAAMEEMKYDMCGGANVLGAVIAMAKLKLKVNVIALVPATENMPGGAATKPGDIHTARNGKTFEVNNTDAEGRLILSDALVYGSEMKPEIMIDAATLTGAMVIALGNVHTGFFTRNDKLADRIRKAAKDSGEWVWQMPLTDFHVKDMKGTFADLSNMSSAKGAGSATAAAFLEQFVEEGIPWAHFDIAGTGWAVGNRLPYCTKKGASGVMVRTFVELAKQFE